MGLKQLLIDTDTGLFGYTKHEIPQQPNGKPFRQRSFGYGENAPLVTKGLPGVEQESNNVVGLINQVTNNFVRGGVQGALTRSATDAKRLVKFILTPQGLSFIANNIALQRTNPKNITSPRNRQFTGFGTLASSLASFAGIRFRRDGLIDLSFEKGYNYDRGSGKVKLTGGAKKYEYGAHKIAAEEGSLPIKFFDAKNSKNQLIGLYTSKTLNFGTSAPNISSNEGELLSYGGGAHSVFGLGKTVITRYKSNPYGTNPYLPSFNTDFEQIDNYYGGVPYLDFRKIKGKGAGGDTLPFTDPSKHRETVYKIGNVGIPVNTSPVDEKGVNYGYYSAGTIDKVNAAGIFKRRNLTEPKLFKDFIKFRIAVVDVENPLNDCVILFRAFLDNITDNFAGSWNSHKYNGRAEKFYIYEGFDRQIQFNFKIAAQTRHEMKPLWRKLNFLVAQTAPQYKNRRMRGVFSRLTIGDWMNEVPGFFNNINLTWNTSYPWEVRSDGQEGGVDQDMNEYPHVLDVSCAFTPIHNFTPENSTTTPFLLPERGGDGREWWRPTDDEIKTEARQDLCRENEELAFIVPETPPLGEITTQADLDLITQTPSTTPLGPEPNFEFQDLQLDDIELEEEDFIDEELDAALDSYNEDKVNQINEILSGPLGSVI
jgi:hypothetical protein